MSLKHGGSEMNSNRYFQGNPKESCKFETNATDSNILSVTIFLAKFLCVCHLFSAAIEEAPQAPRKLQEAQ